MLEFPYSGNVSKKDLEWALRAAMCFMAWNEIEKRSYESEFGDDGRKRFTDILDKLEIEYW